MNNADKAIIAAAQASEATTELLRFHREGPAGWTAFGDIEVVEKLTEALALSIELQQSEPADPASADVGYAAALDCLRASCLTFIEDWVG